MNWLLVFVPVAIALEHWARKDVSLSRFSFRNLGGSSACPSIAALSINPGTDVMGTKPEV
jgi:hypothetical protein